MNKTVIVIFECFFGSRQPPAASHPKEQFLLIEVFLFLEVRNFRRCEFNFGLLSCNIKKSHRFGLGMVISAWAWSIRPGHGRIFESHATTLCAFPAGAFLFFTFIFWISVFCLFRPFQAFSLRNSESSCWNVCYQPEGYQIWTWIIKIEFAGCVWVGGLDHCPASTWMWIRFRDIAFVTL